MSDEGNKKLYEHYKSLSEGSYKSSNPIQNDLVKSDAIKHLADLIKKNPGLKIPEKVIVQKETKSKEKK